MLKNTSYALCITINEAILKFRQFFTEKSYITMTVKTARKSVLNRKGGCLCESKTYYHFLRLKRVNPV